MLYLKIMIYLTKHGMRFYIMLAIFWVKITLKSVMSCEEKIPYIDEFEISPITYYIFG